MKAALLVAGACLLAGVSAHAADQPCVQWGPNSGCLQQIVPAFQGVNGQPQTISPAAPLPVTVMGASATSTTPTALTPTTIAATNTYQQTFAAGAASTTGGVLQASSANAAAICLDISRTAASGLTTPTGGQVCAQPGTAISFPATAGGGFVYGAKGDTFSGSAS